MRSLERLNPLAICTTNCHSCPLTLTLTPSTPTHTHTHLQQRKVEDNTSVLRGILETEAAEMIGSAVTLPYGLRVGPIIPGKCRVMSSKAKPFMLAFEKPVGYDFAEDK